MKKAILTSLLLIFVLSVSSCCASQPEQAEYNVFFSESVLAEYDLEDMPIPSLKNSVIYGDEINTLYLNLTEDELEAYTDDLLDYVLSREDIYYKGVWYTADIAVGPLFLPLSIDVYIPLEDNVDQISGGYQLAFTKESELSSGWVTDIMSEAYEIVVRYEQGAIDEIDFEYNTVIKIGKAEYARFDACAKEHKYGKAISYPVPGAKMDIDVSYCTYCGAETQSYYYGGGDYNEYATIIANGAEYLERECYRTFTVNPTCYAGLIEYVVIPKSDTAEYTVTVNGIEIPLSYEEDNCLYYGFIMPCCDVEIAITEVVEQDIH